MTLQIVSLKAENYKRLKAVEINPEGNVVFVGGRNAQGKTSVLDAIWAALAGGEASRATQQPIREGQDSAVVRLDLGDYVVTRRWTKDDAGTLTVESADGAKYSSPQKLLDEVIGTRAFDPLAFTRLSAKDQVAALTSLVDLPFDPDELTREAKGVFDTRTEVNRDAKRLEGQVAGFPAADDSVPVEEVSAADVLAEFERAREHNARLDRAVDGLADMDTECEKAEAAVARLADELDAAKAYLERARVQRDEMYAAFRSGPERIDTSEISDRLNSVEETNRRVREQAQRRTVTAELAARRERSAQLTIELQKIEKRKADGLAKAEFPVDGLSFDTDGVTFNGIAFSQASAAEQLRVSVALAMAANPKLRVLRILDGSLLDSDSLKIIGELAAENQYQVWIEVVDETGNVGVVIEDGQVRE
ncbi:AAA family ATPase [Paramicrobacterium chengjingii]|uniref:AAA family ATPase n=1 Tax=Paramicrobacterium chengjingii TaxID=2769067 RepID=A0ABX6YM29_9MICO|nr:AAA family ATPase [Microbacterium chengjingii]QPZ39730.1 AAA family ATPase [Microbacterium chengjingii]